MGTFFLILFSAPFVLGLWALSSRVNSLPAVLGLLGASLVGFPAVFWVWASLVAEAPRIRDSYAAIVPFLVVASIGYPSCFGLLTQAVVLIARSNRMGRRWEAGVRLIGMVLLYVVADWILGSR